MPVEASHGHLVVFFGAKSRRYSDDNLIFYFTDYLHSLQHQSKSRGLSFEAVKVHAIS